MYITKENVEGLNNEKLTKAFLRLDVKEMRTPEIVRARIYGVQESQNIDFDIREDVWLSIEGASLDFKEEFGKFFFGEKRFNQVCFSREKARKYIKEKKLWEQAKNEDEFSKIVINHYYDALADLLSFLHPVFPKKEFFDKEKVEKLLKKEHLDFLDFSKCEERFLEKNKKFFELCEDKDTILYYVEKDSNDYFYDLMCVVKNNIPLFIPVPIFKDIMKLDSEENINMSRVDLDENGKNVYTTTFIHYSQSEKFLNKFETFFELRNL